MSDLSDDIFTEGVLLLDELTEGVFDFDGDSDWYRFEAEALQSYQLGAADGQRFDIATQVFDAAGALVWDLRTTDQRFIASQSGVYFLAATQPETAIVDYQLQFHSLADDHAFFGEGSFIRAERFPFVAGRIEQPGDADVMTHRFARGAWYTVTVHGSQSSSDATLEDPIVRIYRLDDERKLELIAADNNSGPGRSAQVRFRPLGEPIEDLFVMVNAVSGTGTYEVAFQADDDFGASAEDAGQLNLVPNWNLSTPVEGNLELLGDVDQFNLSIPERGWYRVNALPNQTPQIEVTDPQGNVVSQSPDEPGGVQRQGVFFATQPGDFTVRVSSFGDVSGSGRLELGKYELTVDARQPFLEIPEVYPGSEYTLFISPTSEFEFSKFHVRSDSHFSVWPSPKSDRLTRPNTVYEIESNNFRAWPASGLRGPSYLWVRGFEPVSGRWTNWEKTYFQKADSLSGSFESQRLHVGTFAFAEALPTHWEGVPSVDRFEPFTEAERTAFREALNAWQIRSTENPDESFQEIAPGENNDAAEVMLFKSNVDGEFLVVPNDWVEDSPTGRRGDVIFQMGSEWLAPEQLEPGNRGFYEFLRAVGNMVGTKSQSWRTREFAVLGQREATNENLWPSTPLPTDVRRVRPFEEDKEPDGDERERYEIFGNNPEDNFYRLDEFGISTTSMILDDGGLDWVAGTRSGDHVIDLRAEEWSGQWDGETMLYGRSIVFGSQIENASGSPEGNDTITGNYLDNALLGLAGDDILTGDSGNDRLYGGAGNDRYQFSLGDDRDIIHEQGQGGSDSIEIYGFGSFNNLADLSFRKLADGDMLIRLQLDGDGTDIYDSIRVREMGEAESRVEKLAIYNQGNLQWEISLGSVYDQLTRGIQRFEPTGQSDEFGRLVRPV